MFLIVWLMLIALALSISYLLFFDKKLRKLGNKFIEKIESTDNSKEEAVQASELDNNKEDK